MNPLPPESEEYEAMMAEQASEPGAGYGTYQAPEQLPPPPAMPRVTSPAPPPLRQTFASMDVDSAYDRQQAMPMTQSPPIVYGPPQAELTLNPDVAARGHMLGFTSIASGIGMLIGVRLGGGYGAAAGALFAGAAVNAYRAALFVKQGTPVAKKEAAISGTYALIAGALGGYVVYKFRPGSASKTATPNPNDAGPSCLTRNQPRSCGIRAIV